VLYFEWLANRTAILQELNRRTGEHGRSGAEEDVSCRILKWPSPKNRPKTRLVKNYKSYPLERQRPER